MRRTPPRFLKRLGSIVAKVKKINFEHILALTTTVNIRYPIVFSALVAGIGILINTVSQDKFPLFLPFEMALYFTLATAYYSIRKNQKFFASGSDFRKHSAGEYTILVECEKYERVAKSSYNLIFPILFGGGIAVLTAQIFVIRLDSCIRSYCLLALAVILSICAIGFFQYFYFILFLLRLAKKAESIKTYDRALPAKTNWLVDLASMANSYSSMYFLVGLVYIILFYVFSFSDHFGNVYSITSNPIVLYILWSIIIIIIIIGFPITTLLGLYALRKITIKLKEHQEERLRGQKGCADNDASLQAAIDSLLILLNTTPDIPKKPVVGYLCSGVIGTINLLASIQAVSLLIPHLV